MPSWNCRPAVRTSWVTGLPTQPAKPCVRCKGEATGWVAYEYTTGRKGRVTTGYRPVCDGCSEPYCRRMNAKAARERKPTLAQAIAEALKQPDGQS
jgi:hypothetical protein